jgi:predicted NAD-dependent protein-ADP-ribosyltransferase YbiA (DUF1768 family)
MFYKIYIKYNLNTLYIQLNMCQKCHSRSTWDGKPGYCSKTCRDTPTISVQSIKSHQLQTIMKDVGFFYKPNDKLDRVNRLGFLGNFYEYFFNITIYLNIYTFKCAEGAFQSLKDFSNVDKYLFVNGDEAYNISRANKNIDRTYNGFESNWKAMLYVLIAKFSDPQLQIKLLNTPFFLLEHNEKERDKIWSDNYDGTGENWLGLQLMLIRQYVKDNINLNTILQLEIPIDINYFAKIHLGIDNYTDKVKYYATEINKYI